MKIKEKVRGMGKNEKSESVLKGREQQHGGGPERK